VKDLNTKNPAKGTYRIANTTAAATDSMPITFAKSIFVDDIFGRSDVKRAVFSEKWL
jgi:hypothetical protein